MDASQAQIAAIVAEWTQAWNAHDAVALACLVTADVDFVNVAGRWLQGAQEFRQWHRMIHQTHLRQMSGPLGTIACVPWRTIWCSFTSSGRSMVHWRRTETGNRNETASLPGWSHPATAYGGSSPHTTRIWRTVPFTVSQLMRLDSLNSWRTTMTRAICRRQVLSMPLALFTIFALGSKNVFADDYPNRPIHLLVGGAAGSVPDTLARSRCRSVIRHAGPAGRDRRSSRCGRHDCNQCPACGGTGWLHACACDNVAGRVQPLSFFEAAL